jgi:hypothetical protein
VTVTEYCEVYIRDHGSVVGIENDHRRVIEELAVSAMHSHVRQHLGPNPYGLDSNVNVIYLSLLATIIRTMRNKLEIGWWGAYQGGKKHWIGPMSRAEMEQKHLDYRHNFSSKDPNQ